MGRNVHVAPRGSIWEVQLEGHSTPSSLHKSRDSAYASAKSIAKKKQTTVVLHYSEEGDLLGSHTDRH